MPSSIGHSAVLIGEEILVAFRYIPSVVLFLVAAASAAVYLILMVRWMPTRSFKIKAATTPAVMAVMSVLTYLGGGYRVNDVLILCTLVLLTIPLGFLGHQQEVAAWALREENGEGETNDFPQSALVQTAIAGFAAIVVFVWIRQSV
ncbi:hypothetical protein OG746_36545 [Streptomyces sp. NBC_01016]|uniref:hypothetical protein n=1 Tax=Streptomyces sp. NBC_01016 TaxID=2903720 RepID=UPI00224E4A22|nr:hypothetical protein [Streptomyces sp. NBC_01016]MCX4834242.1 hypothetical protein [Streptomyces sp. NBC_01016]